MQGFRKLRVWEKAHHLTLDVYSASRAFPREEMYGLTSQMRRASTSIGCNIAEGCCRKGDAELSRFLQMAMGSASELEYQFLLARDLQLLECEQYQHLSEEVVEVKRMLASLIQRLKMAAAN
jgi:four helix bundle protein